MSESNEKHYVVILNDDFHSFDYVTEIAVQVFGCDQNSRALPYHVHNLGKIAIEVNSKDLAQQLCERVKKYSPDPHMTAPGGAPTPLGCEVCSSSELGDVKILGTFDGTTTRLHDEWIGFEEEDNYRTHQFAIGCVLAAVVFGLIIFAIVML